jgi:hypothetical protein
MGLSECNPVELRLENVCRQVLRPFTNIKCFFPRIRSNIDSWLLSRRKKAEKLDISMCERPRDINQTRTRSVEGCPMAPHCVTLEVEFDDPPHATNYPWVGVCLLNRFPVRELFEAFA